MSDVSYDKRIGTEERSVVAGTKLWAMILGVVLLIGIGILVVLFMGTGSRKGVESPTADNAATRPAEP